MSFYGLDLGFFSTQGGFFNIFLIRLFWSCHISILATLPVSPSLSPHGYWWEFSFEELWEYYLAFTCLNILTSFSSHYPSRWPGQIDTHWQLNPDIFNLLMWASAVHSSCYINTPQKPRCLVSYNLDQVHTLWFVKTLSCMASFVLA